MTLQEWKKNTFEFRYLKNIQIKYLGKVYIGFDYGYFKGINIYFKDNTYKEKAYQLKNEFDKKNIFVRLCTNLPSDYDFIILLGYSNLLSEKIKLIIQKRKIKKALSTF